MPAESLGLRVKLSYPGFDLDVGEEIALQGVTALFGPSGSGKSTLLRAIAGLERPDDGHISLGQDVWFDARAGRNEPVHRRAVGFMFQDARLFEHLTVSGNLQFADRRGSGSSASITFDEVVSALELRSLLERRISALSGGERQRVALGRSLLTRPRLLLLDEPLSALDDKRKAEILPYLERVPARFGIPTIFVSHALDEVVQLAGSMLVLADGRVRAYGPTKSIIERLDLQPITGRIDAGVLVDARVAGHDRRLALTHVNLNGETLKMPIVERLGVGETIRLRIRARDVAIATRRPEGVSIRNILPATVEEVSLDSESAFAEIRVSLGRDHIRARLTREAVEELELAVGMPVFALIKSVSFDRRME